MRLSEDEVKHIAHLARIELIDEEIQLFKDQLSDILEYVGQLDEIDFSKERSTYSWDGYENIYRDDETIPCDKEIKDAIFEQAPSVEDGYIKVKSVF